MGEVSVRTGSFRTSPTQMRSQGERPPRLAAVTEAMPGVEPFYTATPQNIVSLPAVVNLTFYQGDDFFLDMTVTDQNNNLVDLTNTQPLSQIRPAPDATSILASFVVTIDTGQLGLLHLQLPAVQSNALPLNAVWDIQLSNPYITTLAAGTVTCEPQVTQ